MCHRFVPGSKYYWFCNYNYQSTHCLGLNMCRNEKRSKAQGGSCTGVVTLLSLSRGHQRGHHGGTVFLCIAYLGERQSP